MTLTTRLYRSDDRQADRFGVDLGATVRATSTVPLDAIVTDLSETGFRATVDQELPIGTQISVGLSGVGLIAAQVVRRTGMEYGCEFLAPITRSAIARATEAETVIPFPVLPSDFFPAAAEWQPEPEVEKYPGWIRLGIVGGASILLWGILIAGVTAIL